MKKNYKILVILGVIIALFGVVKVYCYLSVPVVQKDNPDKYALHQYLTSQEVKEREEIDKTFKKSAELAGSDVQKQKEITQNYQEQVKQFNIMIYEKNEQRFKKYIDKITLYFKEHPNVTNKKALNQYIYLMSNVELKLFQQAAENIKVISKELTINILEVE